MKTKTYAIITDPFSSGALYAPELIKCNITPIAVLSQFPILAIYASSFQHKDFAHIFVNKNDVTSLIKDLELFFDNKILTFILAGSECGVFLSDQLSAYFCPKLSNGTKLSSARRDKFDMMKTLSQKNISVPFSVQVSTIDEALKFCRENVLFPSGVVIKPLNSAGTDSVSACFDELAVVSAMQKTIGVKNLFNATNEKMLAQEFLSGVEYVVDTASFSGKHTVTNICRYKKIKANDSRFVYDCVDFLSPLGKIQQELSEYVFTVLDALEIQFGPAHSEVMLTKNGPRLIEIGARVHGGVGISASKYATQSSHLDETLKLFLRQKNIPENKIDYSLHQFTKIVFLISYEDSVIKSEHPNMDIIKNLSSVKLIKLNIRAGDQLKKTVDIFTTPGLLILSHLDEAQLESDYQQIRRLEKMGLYVLE